MKVFFTIMGIILTALAISGSIDYYYKNRLDARDCVESHYERNTCVGYMVIDAQNGIQVPYYYNCNTRVCDRYECYHRQTKHDKWQVVLCK